MAPEILCLDNFPSADRECGSRCYGPVQPAMPAIHVHLADSPIGEVLVLKHASTSKRKRHEISSDNSSGDSEGPIIAISKLLQSLHASRPALNYPKYEEALHKAGIAYANAVLEFEKELFVGDIGMPKGVVGDFL